LAIPLSVVYSVGLRLALAVIALLVIMLLLISQLIRMEDLQQLAQRNHPNVKALVDIQALRDDPLYFWLNLTLVSFENGSVKMTDPFLALNASLWRNSAHKKQNIPLHTAKTLRASRDKSTPRLPCGACEAAPKAN
jgi:hypothetical protein